MFRSARLLRPLAPAGLSGPPSRVLSSTRLPAPKPQFLPVLRRAQPLVLYQVRVQIRGYADDSKHPKEHGVGSSADGMRSTAAKTVEAVKEARQDLQHVTTGAAEEIRGVVASVTDMISGRSGDGSVHETAEEAEKHGAPKITPNKMLGAAEDSSSSHSHGTVRGDIVSITRLFISAVPTHILNFGLAGTIPYLGTAGAIVFSAREASRASQELPTLMGWDLPTALQNLHTLEHVQITYGAIILSFLGALHWGMEFAKYGGRKGYPRLIIGAIPVLFAWPTTLIDHGYALVAQWFGFTGMWLLDQRASTSGWTPKWYSTYRFYLSIIVGVAILATLGGTSLFGAGAGAVNDPKQQHARHTTERVSPLKRLDRVKTKNETKQTSGEVDGPIQVDAGEDSYMVVRNIEKEEKEAEEKEKEEEEKKQKKKENEEFQDKRDEHQQDKSPGAMKDDAKDRTGKNANQAGGVEERPEDEKAKDKQKGGGGDEKKVTTQTGAAGTKGKQEGKGEAAGENKSEGEDQESHQPGGAGDQK